MRTRLLLAAAVTLAATGPAHAQVGVDRRYASTLTGGLAFPTAGLAGEQDARATTINPGGLPLLRGSELALALSLEDQDVASAAGGAGFGTYFGTAAGGSLLPRIGFGMGLEWLRPPRAQLDPDPGAPFRFTMGLALGLGPNAGFGASWHHFHSDGVLAGADTFDLGLSARIGGHVAFGATLTDVATESINSTPIERRYALELVLRPLGTDRLDVAVGGRLGETRHDADGWVRATVRAARGFFVHAQVESDERYALVEDPALGQIEHDGRDVRATLGLELSFGHVGLLATTTALRDDTHHDHALGGSALVRISGTASAPATVLGPADHIERIDLSGDLGTRQLTALVQRLADIGRDPTAKAVVVTFDGVESGWATLEEIRNELIALRRVHGKKVFAYMVSGTGRDYFVASAADKIYIDPAGGLRVVGMAGTSLYFRGAFDMLGVEPQFEKIAEFKSAPEEFTESGPTAIAAKMHEDLFEGIWQRWLAAVSEGRHATVADVTAFVDAGPYSAGDLATNAKWIDAVAVPEKVAELVAKELGGALPVDARDPVRPDRWSRPEVAVIYVDGDITDGVSHPVTIPIPILGGGGPSSGGQTLVAAISAARADPAIGAIVLRIDSPGGSALASELISREVFATRGVKPIVCSFGNYAASGGYFAAAGCDVIYAEPTTITGSIGIFYGKFDIGGLLKKLGVSTDTWKRGKHADAESMFRPYNDEERAVLLDKLRYSYGRFVGAVAEGRGMTKEAVDAVGRGHVFTGEQAKPLKLVDRYGGVNDAIADAKARMGVAAATQVTLVELPDTAGGLLGAVSSFAGAHVQSPAADAVTTILSLAGVRDVLAAIPLSVLANPGEAQARLPVQIVWQ